MQKKHVYIITSLFPFGSISETFLMQEVALESQRCKICIVPVQRSGERRQCPPEVEVDETLCRRGWARKIRFLLATLLCPSFWQMLLREHKGIKNLNQLKKATSYFYGALLVKDYFRKKRKEIPQGSVLYSYWFSYEALGLAMAREAYPELASCRCISRAHGYDVYMESRNVYIPCREFILEHLDVYTVSKTQCEYLSQRYPKYSHKFHYAYLGIAPIEVREDAPKQGKGDISFVTCSSEVPEKRMELIFSTVSEYAKKHSGKRVCWTHIGRCRAFDKMPHPANLTIDLKGLLPVAQVHATYQNERFDIFLNLSRSEGLPVSLMEAISAGIPIIATDAGGSREIACPETGCLLPVDFSYEAFEQAVDHVMNNHAALKRACRDYFMRNFVAKNNFNSFYDNLLREKCRIAIKIEE